jgi:major membrane immunogen (membrane-anchored lipoprotein)
MRAAVLIIAVLLTACGKKEMPREAQGRLPFNCHEVRILSVSGNDTLMETTDGTKRRFIREGNFGSVGDTFAYCAN